MKAIPNSLTPAARFLARHSGVIVLAVFALVGVAVLDDYGISSDEVAYITMGIASFDYILGDEDALIREGHIHRVYSVAFEVPLIAVERLLRLEDSRDIFLSRHLLTHSLFLAAGFFAWLLAYRLFGSRLIALLAMLLFLLHPRLYAHSFFNTRDLPFLSVFMIALYLTHRAFRRDTVWAFALCGAGVGLLANIRIMGVMLIPAVLGMLALDAFYAMKRGQGVKHMLANICAFSTMCAATLYAAWPALWRDPSIIPEALGLLSGHPLHVGTLFRGEVVRWPNLPWDYAPTWILITTPPVALLLAALGIAYLARVRPARWRGAFENSLFRFGLLALACLTLPLAATIALNSNMFNGWRHMYFLYAPICVLAAFGLRALADIPKPSLRAAAFAAATLGIVAAIVQMVHLRPHQNDYFNSLVDKNGLAGRWEMDYWHTSRREALEALLTMQPNGRVTMRETGGLYLNMMIIPENDRRRLRVNPNFPSFSFIGRNARPDPPGTATVWTREIYGVPIVSIRDRRARSEAAHERAYAAARASEPVASAGGFDIYEDEGDDGGALTYVKDDCGEESARGWFALSIFPLDQSDLPKRARDAGLEYESIHFHFHERGAVFDGRCVVVKELPDYAISHIETWRYMPGESPSWSALILLDGHYERYRQALASLPGEPAIRSDFDVYMKDGALTYVKEGCAQDDARGRFFLSVFPADSSDLSQYARDAGLEHEPLNFDFARGAVFDGKCAIIQALPDYPISRIETGQWIPDGGELWRGEIPDGRYRRYRDALASLSGEPAIRSDFDVYLKDGTLTYVKAPCAEDDTRGRFFLSVFPADPRDLPQAARDAGFEHEPLNFDFDQYGAILDGNCVIIRDLPNYPISRIETGQFIPGEGELWSARAAVGD